jgi:hypothetical protein
VIGSVSDDGQLSFDTEGPYSREPRSRGPLEGVPLRALAFAAALLLAACSGSAPATTPASGTPFPSSSAPVASAPASPAPSATCLDRADLADKGDTAVNAMQGLIADLKIPNVAKATADAGTAAAAIRKVADFVAPVQPGAAQGLETAAGEVDSAVPQFPAGASLVDKVEADMESAFTLARTAACPG